MNDALWNIEAIDERGESLGVADMVTFSRTKQKGVVGFEAVWPMWDRRVLVRVTRVRIEGKVMELQHEAVMSPGDSLRIKGFCAGHWAGREGRLDG